MVDLSSCPSLSITILDHRRDISGTLTHMARSTRSTQLETRSARLRLPVAKKPVFVRIAPRIGLGYRRNRTAGTWVARVADGSGGNWIRRFGVADDFEDADGNQVLDFWQAQEKARALGRSNGADSARPITIVEALALYENDLRTRSGDNGNVVRLRAHLPASLGDKPIALLSAGDLRRWRDGLIKSMTPSSANRTAAVLKAALNLAAEHDERVINERAWQNGLAAIPDATRSRNVIIDDSTVRSIIAAAYALRTDFGLLVELAAVTGARVSQIARLEVQDVQADRADPRVLMPTSRKGRGKRMIARRPVPIPPGFAGKLARLTVDRPSTALLLLKRTGEPWKKSDHRDLFRRAAKAVREDPDRVTIYALRHSNIVRQLLAGVPIRVVAVNHDTSVTMIERTYSRHIGDHADVLARGALLDTSPPEDRNVLTMRRSAAIG
jgi:integrase